MSSKKKAILKRRCELIKSKVEHEDLLISNRLNWMFALQVGLLVAYFSSGDCNNDNHSLIAIIGLVTSLTIGYNLIMGECSLKRLRDKFEKEYIQNGKCSINDKLLIVGHVGKRNHFSILDLLLLTYFIPLLFFICWLYLLLCESHICDCIKSF